MRADKTSASKRPNWHRSSNRRRTIPTRLQQKLDSLAQQSTQDAARAKASEAKVSDLTRELQEQQAALEQRDELLSP